MMSGEERSTRNPQRSRGLLYGRRKGKPLKPKRASAYAAGITEHQIDLSKPIKSMADMFEDPVSAVAMEIGFGAGEHLLHQLALRPDFGFIGCEPFHNGMASLIGKLVEHPDAGRVAVHEGDAREIIALLPANFLTQVFLLYPDPWPKTRHEKRRFIAGDTLTALARVMVEGSELRVATDIDVYKKTVLKAVANSPYFSLKERETWQPWADWQSTRYETKALRAGRTPSYYSLVRTHDPIKQRRP
ncbi:MAG: tRNA (guanosine(46)-N7)-methyltransferase TrmB [Pseudomonadota bacterium]